eukprot:6248611-Ditylum_brightwellii.AAC.1
MIALFLFATLFSAFSFKSSGFQVSTINNRKCPYHATNPLYYNNDSDIMMRSSTITSSKQECCKELFQDLLVQTIDDVYEIVINGYDETTPPIDTFYTGSKDIQ